MLGYTCSSRTQRLPALAPARGAILAALGPEAFMSFAFKAVLASLCFFIRSLTCLQHGVWDSLASHLPLHWRHHPSPWQMHSAKAGLLGERERRQLSAAQALMLAMASDNLATNCRPQATAALSQAKQFSSKQEPQPAATLTHVVSPRLMLIADICEHSCGQPNFPMHQARQMQSKAITDCICQPTPTCVYSHYEGT